MLSTGNIIPLSNMLGNRSIIADVSNATNCVFATVDMSSPSDNATIMYIHDTRNIQNRLPDIGTRSRYFEMKRMVQSVAKNFRFSSTERS